MLAESMEGFNLPLREEILKSLFLPALHLCRNVAKAEKPHPDVMDLLIGILKAGLPTDFAEIFERPS
jgi:hypothetical protein